MTWQDLDARQKLVLLGVAIGMVIGAIWWVSVVASVTPVR